MKQTLAIDRFDGLRKEIAVLLTEDGRYFMFPRDLMPQEAREGELLTFDIERDLEGTARLHRQNTALRHELDQTDPGGDISL